MTDNSQIFRCTKSARENQSIEAINFQLINRFNVATSDPCRLDQHVTVESKRQQKQCGLVMRKNIKQTLTKQQEIHQLVGPRETQYHAALYSCKHSVFHKRFESFKRMIHTNYN